MAGIGSVMGLIKALENIDSDVIVAAINDWLDKHPEATTTVEDGAITYAKLAEALQAKLNKKADDDGYYEEMTVGDAEQLVATVGVNDKVPYLFRTSGGSADIGDREVDEVVGGSFPWNQLNDTQYASATKTNYSAVYDSATRTFTVTVTTVPTGGTQYSSDNPYLNVKNLNPTHKYLLFATDFGGELPNNAKVKNADGTTSYPSLTWNKIVTGYKEIQFYSNIFVTANVDDHRYVKNPQVFDLTQMFGSTIADYIASLESSTAGAGVAWFRKLFPKPYYQYCAGSMESVETDLHKMTGFNAYNHATGKAKVVGGHEYEIVGTYTSLSMNGETITPVSGKFTPAESGEITVTGGDDSTTCIHLRWDGERDGEYEPYVASTYSSNAFFAGASSRQSDSSGAVAHPAATSSKTPPHATAATRPARFKKHPFLCSFM